MQKFGAFFLLEWRRFLNKRNLTLLLILFLILLYLLNIGINKYKKSFERIEKFKESEINNFHKFRSYEVYGDSGISILFNQSLLSIFFVNTGIPPSLIGKIDTYVHLGIFDNFKDNSLFTVNFTGLGNCAGILLLLGSLMVLFLGYETFISKDYLKYLSSILSKNKVYFCMVLSRFILIGLSLLAIFAGLILFAAVRQLDISQADMARIFGYFLIVLLVMIFFFMLGVPFGFKKKNKTSVIIMLMIWFIFLFIIPSFIIAIVENRSIDSTEDYQKEIEKSNIMISFEKWFIEKAGKHNINNKDVKKEFMEIYWNRDYKKIENIETQLKEKIESNINFYKGISIFIPTNFYYLTGSEVGSNGLDNFISFYDYLQKMKREFLRFYLDRVYYNDPRVMVNFIKGDENIFYAQSRLPENFWSGVLITGAYSLVLVGLSLLGFRRFIYKPGIKKVPKEGNPEIHLSKKNYFVPLLLFKGHHGFNEHLYNLLSGRLDAYNKDIKMTVDNIDVCDRPGGWDFLYLCHHDRIPGDIPASAYILFVSRLLGVEKKERNRMAGSLDPGTKRKPLSELDDKQKGQAYLSVLPYFKRKIFLLDDVHLDMSAAFIFQLQDIMMDWAAQDSAVILLTTDFSYKYKLENFKKAHNKDVEIIRDWVLLIRELKSLLDEEEGEPVKQT